MTYRQPLFHRIDLTTAIAMCTPAPRGPENCGSIKDPESAMRDGIYVGPVGGTDTCLVPLGKDPSSNVEGTAAWLNCVLAGGC